MELFPILDSRDTPSDNLWYVISSKSSAKIAGGVGSKVVACGSDVYITCGAQPDQSFGTVFKLSLDTFKLTKDEHEFTPRYEHGAVLHAGELLVFGGADTGGNRNDLQSLKLDGSSAAEDVEMTGTPPSPRTIHNVATQDSAVYVWGGGALGGEPVKDTALHRLDLHTREWKSYSSAGSVPSPRHGHVTSCVGDSIYVHGGMCGESVFGDLFSADIVKMRDTGECVWEKVTPRSDKRPVSRAAHSSTARANCFYVFGGFTGKEALDDIWRFDTQTQDWIHIEVSEPRPPPRLDMTICTARLPVSEDSESKGRQVEVRTSGPIEDITSLLHEAADNPTEEAEDEPLLPPTSVLDVLLLFGGMDLVGNIFNDLYLLKI